MAPSALPLPLPPQWPQPLAEAVAGLPPEAHAPAWGISSSLDTLTWEQPCGTVLGGGGGGGGRPRLPPASFQSARRPSLSRPRRQRSLGSEVRPSGEERGAPNGLSQNAPRSLRAWRSTLACGANPLSAWHTEYISLRRSLAPHRSLGVQREALRRGPHPQPSMGWWGMRARGEMPASGAWQELIFGTFGQSRGATEVRSYASYLRSGRQTMPN